MRLAKLETDGCCGAPAAAAPTSPTSPTASPTTRPTTSPTPRPTPPPTAPTSSPTNNPIIEAGVVALVLTPGADLEAAERKMAGVTSVLGGGSGVTITGVNIRAADVNRVLGGLEVVEGALTMSSNAATFAAGDSAAVVFA